MIRVVVIDDHVIVRSGLEQLLATADDIELVGMAANGADGLALVAEHLPDRSKCVPNLPNRVPPPKMKANLYFSKYALCL